MATITTRQDIIKKDAGRCPGPRRALQRAVEDLTATAGGLASGLMLVMLIALACQASDMSVLPAVAGIRG